MSKNSFVDYVTSYFNNQEKSNIEISGLNASEEFFYHTVKRLTKAYELFQKNDLYMGDFLIAFRDYMITFDVAQEYEGKAIKNTTDYCKNYAMLSIVTCSSLVRLALCYYQFQPVFFGLFLSYPGQP